MNKKAKSIIVGTDFSQGSVVALEIAVDIANKLGASIELIWVKREKKLFSNEQLAEANHVAESKLETLTQKYQPLMRYGNIDWSVRVGRVATALAEAATEAESPMIVIGTNGASGFERYLVGSTAVRVVQESPCPTLTVREGFNFHKSLEKIVVPIRINDNSRQKVPPAAQMAEIFGSEIHVLGLIETASDAMTLKTYLKQVEVYLASRRIPYTVVGRKYENYSDALLKYATEVNADLVVINTEQDKLLKQLFLGTNAQQIVHKSQIPVLCIHPMDIGDIAR